MITSDPETCRVFCTDFGSAVVLSASEQDNSSVDNHAVICIFFVITNWRRVRYLNDRTKYWDKTIASNYDKWVFFRDTLSKGEDEYVFHNECLTYIIKFYDN